MIQKKHQKYKKTQFINPIDNKKTNFLIRNYTELIQTVGSVGDEQPIIRLSNATFIVHSNAWATNLFID